jgi:hypothetical protein
MTPSLQEPPIAADDADAGECYRCGYSLVGVADEQPCPECGLLAGRSRRPTEELHHSRPGWLRRLSWGVWLILLAMAMGVAWPATTEVIREAVWKSVAPPRIAGRPVVWPPPVPPRWASVLWYHGPWLGADLAAVMLLTGVALVSVREGYAPADRADRWRRVLLRLFALAPLAALTIAHFASEEQAISPAGRFLSGGGIDAGDWGGVALLVATLGCTPLPVLLYFQLRSLAKRARSAHLAEHCVIVGVGNSLTLLYVPACLMLMQNAGRWGFGQNWSNRSPAALMLMLVLGVLACLFALWNAYLLLSFAVAFGRASRKLRRQWRQSDRAVA